MPIIRKLGPEEIAQRNAPKIGKRQHVVQEYDAMLAGFIPGDWGELELSDDDNRLTIRNRLQAAAKRHNLHVAFQRTTGNLMRFVVEVAPPESPAEAQPTPKKRGRKPRVAV